VKWPVLPSPGLLAAFAACAAIASGAGFALAWNWRGAHVQAAEAHGQAVAGALVAANEAARARQAEATLAQIQAAERAAQVVNRDLQTELERIRAAAAGRPRIVRVPVPTPCPGPAPGSGGPGAAAGPGAGAAADSGGVGGDGTGRHRAPDLVLDVSGVWALVEAGQAVSARLRAAQEACR
jgi:hypothetical protein